MKMPIKSIKAVAHSRADGYEQEVLKRGVIDGEFVVLSQKDFDYIRENFSNKDSTDLPTAGKMATRAIQSAARWVRGGAKSVDEETLKVRIETCQTCEFWNPKGFRNTGRCMKCGCSTWAKLRMATETCPIGKWGPSAAGATC